MTIETIGVKAVAEGAAAFIADLHKMETAEHAAGTAATQLGSAASGTTKGLSSQATATTSAGKAAQTAAGEEDHLAASTKKAGQAATEHGQASKGLGSQLSSLIPTLTGLTAGFAAAFEFKEAISSASGLGSEVSKMRRELGLSAEDASKLHFATQELGIPFDNAERSFIKFEKGLAGVSDAEDLTFTTGKALKDNIKALGVEVDNADGTARPFNDILADLSDKFKEMPDGVQKTALATQLFGKSGAELLPILNQGHEGLAKFGEEAEKMGLVLDNETTAALKKQKLEMREFHAALEGVEVQIGIALIPVLHLFTTAGTEIAVMLNSYLVPAIQTTTDILSTVGDYTWGELPDDTQVLVLTMTALYLASGPLIGVIDGVAASLTGLAGAEALASFMGPQGLIVGAALLGFGLAKLV